MISIEPAPPDSSINLFHASEQNMGSPEPELCLLRRKFRRRVIAIRQPFHRDFMTHYSSSMPLAYLILLGTHCTHCSWIQLYCTSAHNFTAGSPSERVLLRFMVEFSRCISHMWIREPGSWIDYTLRC